MKLKKYIKILEMSNSSKNNTIGITSVSFSKNLKLINKLKSKTNYKIIINNKGRKFKNFELLNFLKNVIMR